MNDFTPLVGTVSFRRVVRPKDFEAIEASVTLQFNYSPEASETDILAEADKYMALAEPVVLSKLGLDGLDEQAEAEQVARVVQLTGGTVETPEADWPTPVTFKGRNGKDIPTNEFKAWAKQQWAAGNKTPFWDNTDNKNPNIKHKATGVAVYLD